jgi:quinol-cytochrome oxidoreductase complex cytochrome b subunit
MAGAEDHDGLRTARAVVVGVLTAQLVVLAATGAWLAYRYLPVASAGWSLLDHLDTAVGQTAAVRVVHRWTALAALVTAVAAAVLVEIDTRRRPARRTRRAVTVAGPALVVLTIAAWFTGRLLPWDQLALWAVTVGNDLRGFGPILSGDRVKYVLIGSHAISVSTMRLWFLLHAVALPVLLGAGLGVVWWSRRRARDEAPDDASPVEAQALHS